MVKVKAKYDHIQVVGNQLKEKAEELLAKKAELDELIKQVNLYWSGTDATQFITKSLSYSASLKTVADTLTTIGTKVQSSGSTYQAISENFQNRMRSI